jgi:hypothetical protein
MALRQEDLVQVVPKYAVAESGLGLEFAEPLPHGVGITPLSATR